MIGILNKAITSIFGKKSDRDLKEITPLIKKILAEYALLENISTDELREKSNVFRSLINDRLTDNRTAISELEKEAEENPDLELSRKVIKDDDIVDELFEEVKTTLIDFIAENKGEQGGEAIDLIMVAKYLERIADHATNIAEWVEFSITGIHKASVV